MSQLVFSRYWNPENVDSIANEEMDLLTSQEQRLPSSCLYLDLQQKLWLRLKVCLTATKSRSKACVFLPQMSGLEADSPSKK